MMIDMGNKIKFILSFCIIIILFSCGNSGQLSKNSSGIKVENIKWYWEDKFNEKDKIKLKIWIEKTVYATEKTLGNFPFGINIYFHKSKSSKEPVPWAHTERGDTQSVHFFVAPDYPLEDFIDDWTAPHEISHLTLPFLGKKYSWFAEGYATYMQCQIMNTMGTMSDRELEEKYRSKINKVKDKFMCKTPFVKVVDSLRKKHDFPAMYWGSVSYFIKADSMIKNNGKQGLNQLIKEYQLCCRNKDKNMSDLINSLDSLAEGNIFSDLFKKYEKEPALNMISGFNK